MTPQQYATIKSLFLQVRELTPGERQCVLDDNAFDIGTRREVERLLAADARAAGPLATGAGSGPPHVMTQAPAAVPERIGSYRVLGALGRGGMGVVYDAEQANPRRRVALKLIRPGLATPEIMRRFDLEAQLLGRLQHPGIAQIIEAAVVETPDGVQPFFAMEHIEGEPLMAFATRCGLDIRQRLELMIQVSAAVQHAHAQGVIHRDLKPANIMVTADGRTKVLDFGVARATDADLQVTRTDGGQLLGTIAYMSPEQVGGDAATLDTRSDVYALGVVTYELLCGVLPYDLAGLALFDAARVVAERAPTPLGVRGRRFESDLETIVGKALAKERDHRYPSAEAFATDLERYLRDEPIVARPLTLGYQLGLFARRNRSLVAALAAVCVLLIGGVIGMAWLTMETRVAEREARRSADRATRVLAQHLDILASASPAQARGRDVTVREVLDETAARLERGEITPIDVAAAMHHTLGVVYMALGHYDDSEEHLRTALDVRLDVLGDVHPDTAETMQSLALVMIEKSRYEDAVVCARRARANRMRLHGQLALETLSSGRVLAEALALAGHVAEARAVIDDVLCDMEDTVGPRHADTLMAKLVSAYLHEQEHELDTAEALQREAGDGLETLYGERHPTVLRVRRHYANTFARRDQDDDDIARFLTRQRQVLGQDHPDTFETMGDQAMIAMKDDATSTAAEAQLRMALTAQIDSLGPGHRGVIITRKKLCEVMLLDRRLDEAEALLSVNLDAAEQGLGPLHPETLACIQDYVRYHDVFAPDAARAEAYQLQLLDRSDQALGPLNHRSRDALRRLARRAINQGRFEEAEPWVDDLVERTQAWLELHPDDGVALRQLSATLSLAGRHDRALHYSSSVLELARSSGVERAVWDATHAHALVLRRAGVSAEAVDLLAELVDAARERGDARAGGRFAVSLGLCLLDQGRFDDAERVVLDAATMLESEFGERHHQVMRAYRTLVAIYTAMDREEDAEHYRARLAAGDRGHLRN